MSNRILETMLDRLYGALLSGPSLNCRPHRSRQRVDLATLEAFDDGEPGRLLEQLLGDDASAELTSRVPMPEGAQARFTKGKDEEGETSPEERAALAAWRAQKGLLTKLRNMSEDARTYTQDTGVHALMLGYPILSIPPGALGGGSRRVLAPVAFVPVSLVVRAGSKAGLQLTCAGDGVDRVVPNPALMAWVERETGRRLPEDLSESDEGAQPWSEIAALVSTLADLLDLENVDRREWLAAEGILSEGGEWADPEPEGTPSADAATEGRPGAATIPAAEGGAPATRAAHEQPTAPPADAEPEAETEDPSGRSPDDGAAPDDEAPEVPAAFVLDRVPLADDLPEGPAFLRSAVLGLFPASNQGLLRDTREMLDEPPGEGPVRAFLESGVVLDAGSTDAAEPVEGDGGVETEDRTFERERFIDLADPCQGRTVALARTREGLVIHGPPGTGKSQTITNIIGDHLAAGERVLFVCDKRTALDVVANRLEHQGLGGLCATVHDPQRDQRDLYMGIRRQLEELADEKTHPRAAGRVEKIDRELGAIHAELAALRNALMLPDGDGNSFHGMVGRWLAIDAPALDADARGLTLESLDADRAAVEVLLGRGVAMDFERSPWAVAASGAEGSLDQFLSESSDAVRQRFASLVEDARVADGLASDLIPPFAVDAPLAGQAATRRELADQLEWIGEHADRPNVDHASGLDAEAAAKLRAALVEAGPDVDAVRRTTLDTELLLTVRDAYPSLRQVGADLAALGEFERARARWYGFVLFGPKGRGREVCQRYGVGSDKDSVARLQAFLEGIRHRHLASVIHERLTGETNASPPSDDTLLGTVEQYHHLLDALELVEGSLELEGPTRQALVEPDARGGLLTGLRQSTARAEALEALETSLESFGLFDEGWLYGVVLQQREGARSGEAYQQLQARFDDLESASRVLDGLRQLPPTLAPVVRTMLDHSVPAEQGLASLTKLVLAATIRGRLEADPQLVRLDRERIDHLFKHFAELEADKRRLVRDAIEHRWIDRQKERLLASTGSRLNSLGAALRQRLFVRGKRAMRLRQVLRVGREASYDDGGGDPLFDMCPIWLCSPETVAQIFPREPLFDTVIFDEASQCRLEEALPVLTRAKRVVIAGDPKQLPPTRFFEAAVSESNIGEIKDEDDLFEAQTSEVEDLLAAALNLSIEESYLDVHYRSKNADLIGFSNEYMYRGRLQAIPGHPRHIANFPPILLTQVNGQYVDRANPEEAAAVVEAVRGLLRRADPPSIGIATFNVTQREVILDALEEAALADDDFADRLARARERRGEGSFEGLFVKNLENVQGDERDVILISTTYGKNPEGRFYRRFGPLGMAGGGRRLNVLVTRSRQEVHLITSIPAEVYRRVDPLPEGAAPSGGWLLFAYLRHAEELAELYRSASPSEGEVGAGVRVNDVAPRSEFAEAFGQHLVDKTELGGEVHWGNEGFCVDVAVSDPRHGDEVTLGVMTDFARFEGTPDTVAWDLYRCGILAWQRWDLHRVWSPHFFRDASRTTNQVLEASSRAATGQASQTAGD